MEEFYWYWLCNLEGIGNKKIRNLIQRFGSAKNIYESDQEMLEQEPTLHKADIRTIIESKNHTYIYSQYRNLHKSHISFISCEHSDYPSNLHNIFDYPAGLYVKGRMPDMKRPAIAIVGSRNCTIYGRKTAYEYAKKFAYMGIQVISGMANGIDAAAHMGCIDGGGQTFAVLGCGVDICYPRTNIELYTRIQETGGIISELCPGTKPFPGLFPLRNRIISGLADVVIVVEAREKSGSLITVDQALEQNRDVMAIPGRIDDPLSIGCNNLIKMGAQMITTPQDILNNRKICDFINNQRDIQQNINNQRDIQHNLNLQSNNSKKFGNLCDIKINSLAREKNMLYSCLNLDPKGLDRIVEETKLNITIVNQILLELQIEGVIKEVSKNSYIRS